MSYWSGLQVTDGDAPEPADVEEAADVEEPAEFDPAAHNVEQVVEYLNTADDDEFARVLDAEQNGKARSGILDHFES